MNRFFFVGIQFIICYFSILCKLFFPFWVEFCNVLLDLILYLIKLYFKLELELKIKNILYLYLSLLFLSHYL